MRGFLSIISVVGVTWGLPQLQFGGPTDADTRSFSEAEIQPSGRVPGGASVAPVPSVQVSNEVMLMMMMMMMIVMMIQWKKSLIGSSTL